jgi:hypothetical protein
MNISRSSAPIRASVFLSALLLSACGVDVRTSEQGTRKEVDIRTSLGDLSVRTAVDATATGLPLYPGARPLRDGDGPETADVRIGTAFFGMELVAAKFESEDAPEAVVGFYRNEMKAYGAVMECRGEIDFRGRRGARQPVCKRKLLPSAATQLVVGTEGRHRLVAVKPRGRGSELAIVYIQTGAPS